MSTYAQLVNNVQRADCTIPTYDTPVALDHYAELLKQEKNVAEASKMQTMAVKFRQQLKEMSDHDHRWQSGMAPL
jgi:exoribonuclease R